MEMTQLLYHDPLKIVFTLINVLNVGLNSVIFLITCQFFIDFLLI